MTRYVIRSTAGRYESSDRERAEKRLAEIRKSDPAARLLVIPAER